MAKIIENEKGFKVIQIDRGELLRELGRYGAAGICDECIKTPDTGYYVAVLNCWLCPDCYTEFYKRTSPCDKDDQRYENKNFSFYKKLFNI